MVLENSMNTENYEIEEIASSLYCLYEFNCWVAVAFGKTWYPGEVKLIGDEEIEFFIWKGLVEHQIASCGQRMKI